MKKLAMFTALLAASTTWAMTASAAPYQFEAGGNYTYTDIDNTDRHLDSYGVNGTYYFAPVQTKSAPLAEAAFLNHASNVSVGVSREDGLSDSTNYRIAGEYFVPNSQFYVGANIGRKTFDAKNDISNTTYGVDVGFLPVENMLLTAGVTGVSHDDSQNLALTLGGKYVTQVGANDVNLEAKAVLGNEDDHNRTYTVKGDYYLDKTFSVGLDYRDENKLDSWGINAKKFFTPELSVDGRIGIGDDVTTYGVGMNYRF